jgi:sugar (pentulose or hexulose) kinase
VSGSAIPADARAAQHLGLAAGTPVALGGGDTRCGLASAGAVSDGDVGPWACEAPRRRSSAC